jgi:type IV secretion system protein VirB10
MSPSEQHEIWIEKKKYERIQGRILAADAAVTSDLTKSGVSSGSGIQPVASDDPIARLAGFRNVAHANVAGKVPAMLAGTGANPTAGTPGSQVGLLATGADPAVAAQLRHREFLKEAVDAGYLPETVKPRVGQHELAAGSIIPAVMLTGINSDLPGTIIAQVRQSIYDTNDESMLIIPQGSRLVGRYSSHVAYGQDRVLVAWDDMIMPNGNRINLRGMSGADGLGQAGFHDQVDNHFFRIWGSALMVSALGVGVQLSQPQNSSVNNSPTASQQAAGAAANSLNQAGSKVLEKNMNISPTLSIRPGYTFNVIVNKSIVMPAYRG